jgi:hypothetical protein
MGIADVSYRKVLPQQSPVYTNITENVRIISALREIRTVYIPNNGKAVAAFSFETCMKDELENIWKEKFVI